MGSDGVKEDMLAASADRGVAAVAKGWQGRIPVWLAARIMQQRFATQGVLPQEISPEDFIASLQDENVEEGPYTPELATMIDSVRRGREFFCEQDPVFYREILEAWFDECFAPNFMEEKMPLPIVEEPVQNRGVSAAAFFGGFVATGLTAVYLIAKWKGYVR